MVKLAVGINVYEDKPALIRCLKSLYNHVDIIIVVDGRYPSWGKPTDPQFSTDGTKELCHKLRKKIDYYEVFDEQPAKRTKYLEACQKHDCNFLLVVDADDYVYNLTDWNAFKTYLSENIPMFEDFHNRYQPPRQVHNIKFIMTPTERQGIGRLIYKPYELRYISHWELVNKNTNQTVRYMNPRWDNALPGLVMSSNDMTRTKERTQIDIDYQWLLFLKEGVISQSQYEDPIHKKVFEDSILNEVYVWEQYYKEHKSSE